MPKTAALAWKPPADDGGAEITNYIVEYRVEGDISWIKANDEKVPELNYGVSGLRPGKIYEFRISAENKAGVGPPSDPTAPTEAKEHIGECDWTSLVTTPFGRLYANTLKQMR